MFNISLKGIRIYTFVEQQVTFSLFPFQAPLPSSLW